MDNNKLQLIKDKLSQPGYITVQNRTEIVSMLSELDPEVAKEVIKQFPELKELALKSINELSENNKKLIESKNASIALYYKNSNDALQSFKKIIEDPNATLEEKKFASDNIHKILDRDDKKDDKNGIYGVAMVGTLSAAFGLVLGVTISVLGSHFSSGNNQNGQ